MLRTLPSNCASTTEPRQPTPTDRRSSRATTTLRRMRRFLLVLVLAATVATVVAALRSRRSRGVGPHGGGTPVSFDTWPEVPRAPAAA